MVDELQQRDTEVAIRSRELVDARKKAEDAGASCLLKVLTHSAYSYYLPKSEQTFVSLYFRLGSRHWC